jgi:hypothetical protein
LLPLFDKELSEIHHDISIPIPHRNPLVLRNLIKEAQNLRGLGFKLDQERLLAGPI